ncbi:unnamed protein product [Mytilus coruscus]|uniref:Uncharacterized protein n=1 Tax=Mytilus coruscus TaxID=42192 RepID=A0A6J8BW98_MYTCO|nr:unnamed protein product [Mytilus coruscus]
MDPQIEAICKCMNADRMKRLLSVLQNGESESDGDEVNEHKQNKEKMASFSRVVTGTTQNKQTENNQSEKPQSNNPGNFVKPIFLKDEDVHGSVNPPRTLSLTNVELYNAIGIKVNLKGDNNTNIEIDLKKNFFNGEFKGHLRTPNGDIESCKNLRQCIKYCSKEDHDCEFSAVDGDYLHLHTQSYLGSIRYEKLNDTCYPYCRMQGPVRREYAERFKVWKDLEKRETLKKQYEDQVEEPQEPSGVADRFQAIPVADYEDEAVQQPPKKKGAMEMARETYQAYQDPLDRQTSRKQNGKVYGQISIF